MDKRVVTYCRISNDRTGEGAGVERQRKDRHELATARGWTVARDFTDNDVSAYSTRARPAYRALLDAVREGQVDEIIAWHPDRLHRSPIELEEFISLTDSNGV
ncbi:MAG TPA: recombinase family protein, partial [Frankiaceae bacterium]|nr:recombinase family protein [Frankiaceae bacterium]